MDQQKQILEKFGGSPEFAGAMDEIESRVSEMPVTAEGVGELIKLLEAALRSPEQYPRLRVEAIQRDFIDPAELPEEFDPVLLGSILTALYQLQKRLSSRGQGFARGGLASAARRLQARGRAGDTVLAHINPREAAMLRAAGGGGSINPATGLPEYFSLRGLISAALPIALAVFAPGLGAAIGGAFGATGAAASMLGGAVIGGLGSAISGGNPLQGAVLGGLGSGLGGALGSAVAPGASAGIQNALGSGLAGGLAGAVTGQGFAQGAAKGALGSLAGAAAGQMGAGAQVQAGAQQFGNMIAAGYDPKTSLAASVLAGLSGGVRPSDAVSSEPATPGADSAGSGYSLTDKARRVAAAQKPGIFGGALGKYASYAPLALGALKSATTPQQVISKLSPEQQEYFNRPNQVWDWEKLKQEAAAQGQSLGEYVSLNWDKVARGQYAQGATPAEKPAPGPEAQVPPQNFARGGLGEIARLARGGGSGRADTIPARLSDGEFVIDAETVALLGDGSTREGARRLDQMREEIRAHKGKALSRGKISPNARPPLNYIKRFA